MVCTGICTNLDACSLITIRITKCLDELNRQIEQLETELESIKAKKGKRDQDRIDAVDKRLAAHRFHVNSIEKCLRMVDNETLPVEKVDEIKDGIEYYIDQHQVYCTCFC